jgi:hypothetical protein
MQMVNGRFLQPSRYGFEMVDAPGACVAPLEIHHQWKIYTESNQSDYRRIFPDLISMQTLAIYPRLLVKDRLREINRNGAQKGRPGTRDVFSASHGILARAGARAVAKGQDA